MVHNKKTSQAKNKSNNEKLSKSIQSKTNKKEKNKAFNNKSSNNNVIALKRSSSGINSIISRYGNDIRNNKTINIDNKWEFFIKNKSFFYSSEIGNINDMLSKKDKTMCENRCIDDLLNKKSELKIEKNDNVIKVNIKIAKDCSPRGNSKMSINESTSKIKNNSNKNLFNKNTYKKIPDNKNNIKNIKYNNISYSQKKFFIKEKLKFFIKKIKKKVLNKYFQIIKMKFHNKNKKYKKHSNIKKSVNKSKSKLNLSSNKKTKPKIFDNKINKSNNNIFKQSKKNENQKIIYSIGLNRLPSQLSIKSPTNKINQSHLQHKESSVKMKICKNSILNNSKNKKNKNSSNLNSLEKNNKQINNNSKKKLMDKKNKSSIKEIKTNNNIQLKEKLNLIKNNREKLLIKSINNDNCNTIKSNEDIQYYNTEISSKIISTIYNMRNRTCKVYENCLLEKNKFYQTKYANEQKTNKNDKNTEILSSPEIINKNINFPFLKKNISPKNIISNKSTEKNDFNIKLNNFNNFNEVNLNFPRFETSPINNNLYVLLKNNTLIKNIFNYWKLYSMKKRILIKLLCKIKFYKMIEKSSYIIIKRIIKIINYCILSKYFNRYKNIYFKQKIIQNLKILKNNEIECINIPMEKCGYDIINNININNYINYSDINKFMKKRTQTPLVLSKLIMFTKENNNNNFNEVNYNGNIFDEQNKNIDSLNNINDFKYNSNLYNYYNENFISFSQTDRFHNQDNSSLIKVNKSEIIDMSINNNIENIQNQKNEDNLKIDNDKGYNNDQIEITKKHNLIDRVNQLRMVFNLLEQHGSKSNTLYELFHKWLYITNLNEKYNNKGLFRSFSGNNNYNIMDDNSKIYNKYSINTYQAKDINNDFNISNKNNINNINSLETGKYTPVRGIKNFRSKTSQKIISKQRVYDYNDINNILYKNSNFNIFDDESNYNSCTLMNNKNNININMVYHKKKLVTPNHLCGNYFLENNNMNNNTYFDNLNNSNSMHLTNLNIYKNQLNDTKSNAFNSNTNISNSELNNTINSFNNKTYFSMYPFKSSSFVKQNMIEEKQLGIEKIINKIEEKEINFALYKRNNSCNKMGKNNINVNINKNKQDEIINIIYKKGKTAINNNFNSNLNYNKKTNIYSNINKIKRERNREKIKNYENIHNKSAIFRNKYIFKEEFDYSNEEKKIINNSFSFFENKKRIKYLL